MCRSDCPQLADFVPRVGYCRFESLTDSFGRFAVPIFCSQTPLRRRRHAQQSDFDAPPPMSDARQPLDQSRPTNSSDSRASRASTMVSSYVFPPIALIRSRVSTLGLIVVEVILSVHLHMDVGDRPKDGCGRTPNSSPPDLPYPSVVRERANCVTWPGSSSESDLTPRSFMVRTISSDRISIARSTPARPPAIRP